MLVAKEEYQATLIGFSGFDGGAMKDVADECLVIPFNSTPQVESFHLAMEHLITNCLRKKIEGYE
jgi:phosphoheptose isomerase